MAPLIKWRDAVEELHESGRPMLVRIHGFNDVINSDLRIRVGDELYLRNVTTEEVRFRLSSINNNDSMTEKSTVILPVNYDGKFEIHPHYPPNHVFESVEDILKIYPLVSDFIYPLQTFTIEGVKVREYELLQVLTTVQDLTSNVQLLEVRNITKNSSHILLPDTLRVAFQQWDDNYPLKEAIEAKKTAARTFSIAHLSDYFCSKLQPMRVKLYREQIEPESTPTISPTKEPALKKKITTMFKTKEKKQTSTSVVAVEEIPNVNDKNFPSSWRGKPLTIQPIHTVHVTNPAVGVKMRLPGGLDMKVVYIDHKRNNSADSFMSLDSSESQCDDGYRTSSSSSESSFSLHNIDVSSLLSCKSKDDAIVAMVTGGHYATSRLQNSLTLGTWVALHRARRVRKLLVMSEDEQKQHFLVSAQYSGEFTRLPVVYDYAGEVPVDGETAYVTRCSANPSHSNLDSCKEGQFVWFHKKTVLELSSGPVLVVHCKVSDFLEGPQTSAIFPFKLKGKFEKLTDLSSSFKTRDLFKQDLPISIRLKNSDPAIGFDPLATKERLMVVKIITELSLIVEILKKSDDAIKSSGTMLEIPFARSSLFVKEILPTSTNGVEHYPRRNDFKGLQKLPSVELVADKDIDALEDAELRQSSPCISSPQKIKNLQPQKTFDYPASNSTAEKSVSHQAKDSGVGLNLLDQVNDQTDSALTKNTEKTNFPREGDNDKRVALNQTDNHDQLKPIPRPRKKRSEVEVVGNKHLPHTTVAPPSTCGQPHSYALVCKPSSSPPGKAYSSPEYEYLSCASKISEVL